MRRPLSLVLILLLTAATAETVRAQSAGSDLEQPVEFVAGDSLVIVLGDSTRAATLFGKASVVYEDARLDAYAIDILFDRDELHARGLRADTGWVGRPTFTQGSNEFLGDALAFNMQTRRGRVTGAQTRIEEGFIRAGVVKAVEDSTLFIRDGVYTTCNCVEDPSYSLRSKKMKMVGQDWIYTGPIRLYLYNVPTPLWLPFGFLPAKDGRRSGPLPPSYGEDEFGFYVRDFGWYFAMNDYMDLQLQGGFWTRGSWESSALYRYRKRYGFDGQLQLDYARFRDGVRGDPDFSVRQTGAFRWDHNQTIGQGGNFTSDINLSSSTYLKAVSQQYDDRVRQDIQSSLRYSKRWSSRSITLQASQRQVLSSGQVSMTLPSFRFSQNNVKLKNLTVGYSMNVDNRFSFTPLSDAALEASGDPGAADITWWDALRSPEDFRRATGKDDPFDFQASHRIPVSAPFSVNRLPGIGNVRLNMSPSFNYTEDWFVRTDERFLNDDSTGVETRSKSEFFALRQFSTTLSAGTVFYGQFPMSAFGFSGLRHTVRPNVGLTFRPDFQADRWGYTRSYTDANGEEVTYDAVSGVGRGRQQSLTFSLNNTFETRKAVSDSLAARPSAVKLLDLALSSSYNFAADSLRLSDIRLTARTKLPGNIDIDSRASFSPYEVNSVGRVIDQSAFALSKPFGRLTSASVTVRTSIRSSQGAGDRPLTAPRGGFVPTGGVGDVTGQTRILENSFRSPNTDFSIPWSLSLDFSYGVTRTGTNSIRRAILNTSFDLSLTPNWKLTGRTGYDLDRMELVTTNLSIARDWDCWQMAFNWIPFGNYQSWGFDLHVKSGHLKDLLRIRQPKSDVRDRFGSLL